MTTPAGILFVFAATCTFLAPAQAFAQGVATQPAKTRPLVGVSYFAGWWPPPRSKWQTPGGGEDWRPKYPDRKPLLGEYNTQETMDREVDAAASNGVDFFAILWYPPSDKDPQTPLLNRGLEHFIASPRAQRMGFIVECCNHPPFVTPTDEQWDACINAWMPAFKHPSYLRVDGRLVFKVHAAGQFYKDAGGDLARARARLDRLRAAVRGAGLGEMVIGAGGLGPVTNDLWPSKLFEFTADYMLVPPLPKTDDDRPFAELADFLRQTRIERSANAIPYTPVIAAGWNPRPWADPRPSFAFPTDDQWSAELRRLKADLAATPNLGIPRRDKSIAPAFTLYAWNEFGEGGILAPTQGPGDARLRAIRGVFGEAR